MQIQPRLAVPPFYTRDTNKRGAGLSLLALILSLALAGCGGHNNNDNSNLAMTAPTGTIGPKTLNVADAAIAGGNPTMALTVSQSVLATDPDNVDALVHEGEAYYALDRCPPANASFQQALKYDPKSAEAENGLGRCLLRVDPVQAEAAFLAATVDDPGNAAAFSNLGIARDMQGNYAGAAAAYQQSLVANPGSTATAVNLGLSLALSGQGNAALQYLGPLATGPTATPKIREDYAVALVASGRTDDARQVLAVDMPPDKIDDALAGYQALISEAITNPPPPAPPPPTQPMVQTAPITQSSASVPLYPTVSAPPPAPMAAVPAPAPVHVPPPAPAKPAVTTVAAARAAKPAAPAPASPPPATQATAVPSPAAVAALPASVPAPAATPDTSPAPEPSPAMGGHAGVQIAALNSEDAAQSEWQKVSAKDPALFEGKSPDIVKVDVGGQTYYRLRIAGFASHADAAAFCTQLTAAGGPCIPANF